jgi:hypothetical protein
VVDAETIGDSACKSDGALVSLRRNKREREVSDVR